MGGGAVKLTPPQAILGFWDVSLNRVKKFIVFFLLFIEKVIKLTSFLQSNITAGIYFVVLFTTYLALKNMTNHS